MLTIKDESPKPCKRMVPFWRGVNFSGWFETRNVKEIKFERYTEKDFQNVKSLGLDLIRLPIRMHDMVSGDDFKLEPLLFDYLDKVVDWAFNNKIYLILDNHSFDPIAATSPDIGKILIPVWTQIAEHFKERGEFLLYEVLNEPHGIESSVWGGIQGEVVNKIREFDKERWVIVGGVEYNSLGKMHEIPNYEDKKLIYTFHFYNPMLFTHQGATWGSPSMGSLKEVPFPFDSLRMPRIPNDLKGTWIEKAFEDYTRESSFDAIRHSLDVPVDFSKNRGDVPVFCGEFGVFMKQSPNEDRTLWYELVCKALNKRNIPWTSWDYYGGFGIFNNKPSGNFESDLNAGLAKAMGLTIPENVHEDDTGRRRYR